MPLKPGKKHLRRNIREMHHSRVYKKVLRKHGRARAHKVAVAAAYSAARRRR